MPDSIVVDFSAESLSVGITTYKSFFEKILPTSSVFGFRKPLEKELLKLIVLFK